MGPTRWRLGWLLLTINAAVVLAGCGGSHSATTASASSALRLAQCMRSHGVPNFPDPTVGGGGPGFSVAQSPGSLSLNLNGLEFGGPVFTAAEQACKLFGPASGSAQIPESGDWRCSGLTGACAPTRWTSRIRSSQAARPASRSSSPAAPHRRLRCGQRPLAAGPERYFNSADVLPSISRETISSWICWVPSKMSRIFTSRAHFSSSSPSP
jgi:hypothetical protein